jgi:hypothetical protein
MHNFWVVWLESNVHCCLPFFLEFFLWIPPLLLDTSNRSPLPRILLILPLPCLWLLLYAACHYCHRCWPCPDHIHWPSTTSPVGGTTATLSHHLCTVVPPELPVELAASGLPSKPRTFSLVKTAHLEPQTLTSSEPSLGLGKIVGLIPLAWWKVALKMSGEQDLRITRL